MTRPIRSPLAQRLQGARAGYASRLVANVIDVVAASVLVFLLLILGSTVVYLLGSGNEFEVPQLNLFAAATGYSVVFILYLASGWAATGRTFGKQVMGLRVVAADGERLAARRAFVRAVVCAFFGAAGLVWVIVSRRNLAVHDIVLRTAVVYDWSPDLPPE